MNKHPSQPVSVSLTEKHMPSAFQWRGRMYRIDGIQESWRAVGDWWDGEGETTFFRVRTDKGGIYELAYNHVKSAWTLEVVRD
ncbi:MAG: DUF6504 family protein [Armatimonadota bacterium]|nr:DUF6504 family protein [Armatimonadota bacterium]